jgi:4-(gamma-glutamylamino)butanal dehydrogenase
VRRTSQRQGADVKQVRRFIGGQFAYSFDGKTFESTSPIDTTAIASLAEGSAADSDRAVIAAGKAFNG